jgi:hypothetical protein
MVSLKTVGERFYHHFEVIDNGTGFVRGILSETEQQSQPSYVFVAPRHVFRTPHPTALRPGMAIRDRIGDVFIVGVNGPSERREGTLWQSFRLMQATGQYTWTRRRRIMDPITKTLRENGVEDKGLIWAALEALDREVTDREMRQNFEQRRVITGANIQAGDLIDNQAITKVDTQLGLRIGVLT